MLCSLHSWWRLQIHDRVTQSVCLSLCPKQSLSLIRWRECYNELQWVSCHKYCVHRGITCIQYSWVSSGTFCLFCQTAMFNIIPKLNEYFKWTVNRDNFVRWLTLMGDQLNGPVNCIRDMAVLIFVTPSSLVPCRAAAPHLLPLVCLWTS